MSNLYTSKYYSRTNSQPEGFNLTLFTALGHYAADHPRMWDELKDVLTFAYSGQTHKSTSTACFDLALTRPPPSFDLAHACLLYVITIRDNGICSENVDQLL